MLEEMLRELPPDHEQILVDTSFSTPGGAFYQQIIYPLNKESTLPRKALDEFSTYTNQLTTLFSAQKALTSSGVIQEMDDLYDLLHQKNEYLQGALTQTLHSYEELINQAEKTSFNNQPCPYSQELLQEVAIITNKQPSFADEQLLSNALSNHQPTLILTRDTDFADALVLLPTNQYRISVAQYKNNQLLQHTSTHQEAA